MAPIQHFTQRDRFHRPHRPQITQPFCFRSRCECGLLPKRLWAMRLIVLLRVCPDGVPVRAVPIRNNCRARFVRRASVCIQSHATPWGHRRLPTSCASIERCRRTLCAAVCRHLRLPEPQERPRAPQRWCRSSSLICPAGTAVSIVLRVPGGVLRMSVLGFRGTFSSAADSRPGANGNANGASPRRMYTVSVRRHAHASDKVSSFRTTHAL